MKYFFFILIFLHFLKINFDFFFNFNIYLLLVLLFIFSLFNLFLIKQYFFFNFIEYKMFFYSFLKWRIFFFNRWFSFLRYNNIFFSYKKNICNFSLSVEGYDKYFKNISILYKKINFKIDNFIFYYPSLYESKFFFFNNRIPTNVNNIHVFKNYMYFIEKYLLITDKKLKNYENFFYNQTKLRILESEKNRMLSSFKDKETIKLISNLLKICSEGQLDPFYSQLKIKILSLCDLEKNKDHSDEEHLIDKIRKLIVIDSNDKINVKLLNSLINSENKIKLFEKIISTFYSVKVVENKTLLDINNLNDINFFQKKILELEKNSSLILLDNLFVKENLTKENSLKDDKKPLISDNLKVSEKSKKVNRRFNFSLKKKKFYSNNQKSTHPDFKDKTVDLNKPQETFVQDNFANVKEKLNFIFQKNYSSLFKKTLYNFFYTSFINKKRFNKNILNFIGKKKKLLKKEGMLESFFYNKKYLYTFFFSLDNKKNSRKKNYTNISYYLSLFHQERVSFKYPINIFNNELKLVLEKFLPWYWGDQTMVPKTSFFKKYIFPLKNQTHKSYPRLQSLAINKTGIYLDKIPLNITIIRKN
jgi:hypothetical protein